ncbi:hypothetical protein RJ639_015054, partial [Escallonia herrerae]
MMQQGDYNSSSYYQYPQNPSPIPTDHSPLPPPYAAASASAPPFATTTNYPPPPPPSSDYPPYPSTYPQQYPQNPDPPTAPSYSPNPNIHSFNQPPSQPTSFPQFESHAQPPYQPPQFESHAPPPYQPPPQPQPYYAPNYPHSSSIPSNPSPNFAPYNSTSSLAPPSAYESPFDNSVKFDQLGGYTNDGGYSRSRSDLGSDLYGKRLDRYDSGGYGGDGYGDGVYAYQGSKVEPYGARGTGPKSSTWSTFDDFGRPINSSSAKGQSGSQKVVRAVPKVDLQQDAKCGVQKYRVKLLPESGSQTMDVLCQIGLDGIRMLDPSTSRTLRIYPLDTITRCEAIDSSIFAFWSKSSVDIDPRRIRLQSNSYTTNTILDTVTAATVQLKEMGGRSRPSDSYKGIEQSTEKKKGLGDWMNMIKPVNEEKDHWVPDEAVTKCTGCGMDFSAFVRKACFFFIIYNLMHHHCRNCGDIFCDKCTHGRTALTSEDNAPQVRVCDRCMAEVTQRLSNAKEAASRSTVLQSHEDLAKKLQEEMERNRKASSGSKLDGSGRRMKEVACPTCTVHLQVQVPSSGSETIECGVCQHPFL